MTPPLTRRDFLRSTAMVGASVALLPKFARAAEPAGSGAWLNGDLHCHTVYSWDVWGGPGDDNTGPDQAYTLGWKPGEQIAIAETRGLDSENVVVQTVKDFVFAKTTTSVVANTVIVATNDTTSMRRNRRLGRTSTMLGALSSGIGTSLFRFFGLWVI